MEITWTAEKIVGKVTVSIICDVCDKYWFFIQWEHNKKTKMVLKLILWKLLKPFANHLSALYTRRLWLKSWLFLLRYDSYKFFFTISLHSLSRYCIQVLSEDGPNHERSFHLKCLLKSSDGSEACSAEGRGMSKKQAKVEACHHLVMQSKLHSLFNVHYSKGVSLTSFHFFKLEFMKESGPLPIVGQSKRSAATRKLRKSKVIKVSLNVDCPALSPILTFLKIRQAIFWSQLWRSVESY